MIRCIGLLVVILSSACRTDGASPDDTNIDGTPDAPTATDVDATVVEDTQTNIRLEAISPDGDALSFDIASEPGFGTLILDGQRVEYTPDADYNGRDSFTFTATDPDGTSAPATVNITVTPVNDAPTARVSDVWRMAGQDVTLDAISTDADGDVVTREWRQLSGPTVDLTGPDPTFR
ncbi:MAG: hypothetical protein ACJARS_003119, partial [bacterium]